MGELRGRADLLPTVSRTRRRLAIPAHLISAHRGEERALTRRFKVGDHVSWNSEAGRVGGRIIKVHTRDVSYKGYTHHASQDDPQYAIKSDKSYHVAMHKGSALRRLRG